MRQVHDMKVGGFVVTAAMQRQAVAALRQFDAFRHHCIVRALGDAGVPDPQKIGAAVRLAQHLRKDGLTERNGQIWRWTVEGREAGKVSAVSTIAEISPETDPAGAEHERALKSGEAD